MKYLKELFDNNQEWVSQKLSEDPDFFSKNASQQQPKYLWIGCSDSRVSPNEILGLSQGDVFVHRNIANLFLQTDFNALSVLEYAVEHLNIQHVIVCGHYGCGGVLAAMEKKQLGLIDNWLAAIRDIYQQEKNDIESYPEGEPRFRRFVELNVLYQVKSLSRTATVQNAWSSGKQLIIHGWVYDISTGKLIDLNYNIGPLNQTEKKKDS